MKPPPFATDLIADLRDRGLLPVAIGLIVAILAVPVLLSKGAEEPAASVGASAELAGGSGPAGPEPVVLASTSEIRAYRERLKAYDEKDPFRPGIKNPEDEGSAGSASATETPAGAGGVSSSGAVTLPSDGGASAGNAGAATSPAPVDAVPPAPAPADPPPVDDPPPSDPAPSPVEGKVLMPVVDLEVGRAGSARSQRGVTVGEYLPGPVDPIAQYFEGALSATEATFLISPTARAVKGDGECRPSRARCRALTLSEGDTAYIIDSTDGARYKLELVAVRLVEIDPKDLETLDLKPGFDDAESSKVETMTAVAVG